MKILCITPNGKHDYLVFSVIEGLKQTSHEIKYSGYGNGELVTTPFEKCIQFAEECDLIMAMWGKSIYNGVSEPYYKIVELSDAWDKTLYIDGSEYNYTGFKNKTTEQLHPYFFNKVKWYFKRECLPEHIQKGVIPFPFSSPESWFLRDVQYTKEYDVLCAFGHTTTGQRKEAVKICEELKNEGYNIINHKVSDYYKYLHKSWITVDAFGGGELNPRTFQAMSNNSMLLMEKFNIVVPNLKEGEHYVGWVSPEDLKQKIRYYLDNKHLIKKFIKTAYLNICNYHTSHKSVEYLLKSIKY